MKIAILRTDQADREQTYNAVEYAAALNGARVVGYAGESGIGSFRGYPLHDVAGLTPEDVNVLIAASPLSDDQRQRLEQLGWSHDRVLSYSTEPEECHRRWQATARWLISRQPSLVGQALTLGTSCTRIGGVAVSSMPCVLAPDAHRAQTEHILDAYSRAARDAPQGGAYAIGRNWQNFLGATRPGFYRAVSTGDVDALDTLLMSACRNEMTTGILGGREAFESFRQAGIHVVPSLRRQFDIWKYSVTHADVNRLGSPLVGNPYGVWLDDRVVHPNTFVDDYRASFVLDLLSGIRRPIIVDIGGGYGGFCQQLMAHGTDAVYVGFDLPENLAVASHFLLASRSDKRFLLYESTDQRLDPATLREYDVVLMPHFMLPRLADGSVDVCTNFTSLSEMSFATIAEYLSVVNRVCGAYFYQENLLDNGENYEFYPVQTFPSMPNFRCLTVAPSRWPFFCATSPHHCHGEVLSIRRDIDTARYLRLAECDRQAPALSWASASRESCRPTEHGVGGAAQGPAGASREIGENRRKCSV